MSADPSSAAGAGESQGSQSALPTKQEDAHPQAAAAAPAAFQLPPELHVSFFNQPHIADWVRAARARNATDAVIRDALSEQMRAYAAQQAQQRPVPIPANIQLTPQQRATYDSMSPQQQQAYVNQYQARLMEQQRMQMLAQQQAQNPAYMAALAQQQQQQAIAQQRAAPRAAAAAGGDDDGDGRRMASQRKRKSAVKKADRADTDEDEDDAAAAAAAADDDDDDDDGRKKKKRKAKDGAPKVAKPKKKSKKEIEAEAANNYLQAEAARQAAEAQSNDAEDPDKLYCICRKKYQPGVFMIGCDVCQEWYHGECVNIKEENAVVIDSYRCPSCTQKEQAKQSGGGDDKKDDGAGAAGGSGGSAGHDGAGAGGAGAGAGGAHPSVGGGAAAPGGQQQSEQPPSMALVGKAGTAFMKDAKTGKIIAVSIVATGPKAKVKKTKRVKRLRRPTEKGRAMGTGAAAESESSASASDADSDSDDNEMSLVDLAKKSIASTPTAAAGAAAAVAAASGSSTPKAAIAAPSTPSSSNAASFYAAPASAPSPAKLLQQSRPLRDYGFGFTPTAEYRKKAIDSLAGELTLPLAKEIESQLYRAVLMPAAAAAIASACAAAVFVSCVSTVCCTAAVANAANAAAAHGLVRSSPALATGRCADV